MIFRVVRAYPDNWSIIATNKNGEEKILKKQTTKPTYQEIEGCLRDAGLIATTVFERLKSEFNFNINSLKQP